MFLPARTNPNGGDDLPPQNTDYQFVVSKFKSYFTKRDPQLMLREKYWLHLKREPGQSFDAWVNTVRKRAGECKFPAAFLEQAIRDKITFTCTQDHAKLKLYDEGASLSLEKAIQILSLKEATSNELQESKTATIDFVKQQQHGRHPRRRPWQGQGEKKYDKEKNAKQYGQPANRDQNKMCGYCGTQHTYGKKNCPAAKSKCDKCKKVGHYSTVCRSTGRKEQGVRQVDFDTTPTFVGGVMHDKAHKNMDDSGWHIQLRADKDLLTWCIDTGAQVSVMPESVYNRYKPSFGNLSVPDRKLVGAGDATLDTIGCVTMELKHENKTQITEQVYVVRGATKLLLGIPAIRSLGLIHEIPGTYSVKVVEIKNENRVMPETDN